MRTQHFKLVGAAGAAALTVGALASPALAAGDITGDVQYTCVAPAGNATPSASYTVDAPPASMVAGQKVSLGTTATVTLDAGTTQLAQLALGWTSFDGTIKTPTSATTVGQNLAVAKTTLANGPAGTTVATATGNTILRASKAGTYTVKLGSLGSPDFTKGNVALNGFDATDTPVGSVFFPDGGAFGQCTNNAGKTTMEDAAAAPATVAVKKDTSATSAKAKYSAAKDTATGTATVKGHFGLSGTGKVKFTLKKGTKTIASKMGTLSKGSAKASFTKVKAKGKYSITAQFTGDAALKGSSGKASFTVK